MAMHIYDLGWMLAQVLLLLCSAPLVAGIIKKVKPCCRIVSVPVFSRNISIFINGGRSLQYLRLIPVWFLLLRHWYILPV
mgnify:FL=1